INAFHGLHGRSITYATGIKLANPELNVLVLMGDGGLGIGGGHFLNAARRNIGITVFVFNNFNYGMTGGQHSTTTPMQGITSTTPGGNDESPVDVCGLVGAVNGTFAARTTVFDKDLTDIMIAAIKHKGFSAVDIWEPCTAYFAKKNELDKEGINGMMTSLGLQKGILLNKNREELTEKINKHTAEQLALVPAEEKTPMQFKHQLKKKTSLIIAGSAGERVISSSFLLAYAGILSGLFVSQKDDFPITVMTGYSVSEIIFSDEEILYTEIDKPDYVFILSMNGYERVKNRIQPNSIVIADESLNMDQLLAGKVDHKNIVKLPIVKEARAIDKNYAVLIGLSAFLKHSKLYSRDSFVEAIKTKNKASFVEKSLLAVELGEKMVGEPVKS
ncbi:MAG TPA: thiamine pyrophosphate-dependent enzyme, partial [Bacteroidia bacterium]